MSQRGGGGGSRGEQCRGNTVTLYYSRYLRLLSSSSVRSTTSAGEAQVCWGATAVHDCVCRALTYCVLEPCFHEETLWITPPRGWTHLQLGWRAKAWLTLSEQKQKAIRLSCINTFPKISLLHKLIKPTINILPPFPPFFYVCLSVCLSPCLSQYSLRNAKSLASVTSSWVISRSITDGLDVVSLNSFVSLESSG